MQPKSPPSSEPELSTNGIYMFRAEATYTSGKKRQMSIILVFAAPYVFRLEADEMLEMAPEAIKELTEGFAQALKENPGDFDPEVTIYTLDGHHLNIKFYREADDKESFDEYDGTVVKDGLVLTFYTRNLSYAVQGYNRAKLLENMQFDFYSDGDVNQLKVNENTQTPNETHYFISTIQPNGPFSYNELKTKFFTADTLIWKTGELSWKNASEYPELYNLIAHFPPPLPNTSEPNLAPTDDLQFETTSTQSSNHSVATTQVVYNENSDATRRINATNKLPNSIKASTYVILAIMFIALSIGIYTTAETSFKNKRRASNEKFIDSLKKELDRSASIGSRYAATKQDTAYETPIRTTRRKLLSSDDFGASPTQIKKYCEKLGYTLRTDTTIYQGDFQWKLLIYISENEIRQYTFEKSVLVFKALVTPGDFMEKNEMAKKYKPTNYDSIYEDTEGNYHYLTTTIKRFKFSIIHIEGKNAEYLKVFSEMFKQNFESGEVISNL